jgi:hypothetical protein
MEMEAIQKCPECGTAWSEGKTCQDHLHQTLFWEAENPSYGEVHHLMVLCYHLQHPSLYSPEGLNEAKRLLVEFLEHGVTPDEARKRNRAQVDSSKRKWKIKGTATSHNSYDRPMQWTMTAADVIADGANRYCDNVRRWAQSIRQVLKATGNYTIA